MTDNIIQPKEQPGNVYIIGQMGIPKSINLIKIPIPKVCLEACLTDGSASDEGDS